MILSMTIGTKILLTAIFIVAAIFPIGAAIFGTSEQETKTTKIREDAPKNKRLSGDQRNENPS